MSTPARAGDAPDRAADQVTLTFSIPVTRTSTSYFGPTATLYGCRTPVGAIVGGTVGGFAGLVAERRHERIRHAMRHRACLA